MLKSYLIVINFETELPIFYKNTKKYMNVFILNEIYNE